MRKKARALYILLPLANILILIISRRSMVLTTHENDDRGKLAPLFIVAVAAVWLFPLDSDISCAYYVVFLFVLTAHVQSASRSALQYQYRYNSILPIFFLYS